MYFCWHFMRLATSEALVTLYPFILHIPLLDLSPYPSNFCSQWCPLFPDAHFSWLFLGPTPQGPLCTHFSSLFLLLLLAALLPTSLSLHHFLLILTAFIDPNTYFRISTAFTENGMWGTFFSYTFHSSVVFNKKTEKIENSAKAIVIPDRSLMIIFQVINLWSL